jgi:acyl carrier protein
LPPRSEWDRLMKAADVDEELRRRIGKIRQLEEAGAEVEVIRADVGSEEEMREVARRSQQRFGMINGIIHAAGITNKHSIRPIQEITPENCRHLFRAKVHGLFVMEKIFQDADLDFCLLLSSLSSVLGGLGFAAYSASNIFMDTFVYGRNRVSPVPWISVDWDGWRLSRENHPQSDGLGLTQAELAIKPKEGLEAFQRVISAKMTGQVIVSTGDLHHRIRQWIDLDSLQREQSQGRKLSLSGHSRPALQTDHVAPRSELEQRIGAIWQDLLGIEQIGIHDNFFELGGHSLLVIQYLSRLRQSFQVEISIQSLFERPTVAGHGEIVEEALIKEIEALTEEEVASLQGRGK